VFAAVVENMDAVVVIHRIVTTLTSLSERWMTEREEIA
jgi:hypothetical protein